MDFAAEKRRNGRSIGIPDQRQIGPVGTPPQKRRHRWQVGFGPRTQRLPRLVGTSGGSRDKRRFALGNNGGVQQAWRERRYQRTSRDGSQTWTHQAQHVAWRTMSGVRCHVAASGPVVD